MTQIISQNDFLVSSLSTSGLLPSAFYILIDDGAANLVTGVTLTGTPSGTDVTITAHGFSEYSEIQISATTGSVDTALALSTTYFIRVVDVNTIRFCATLADARTNTAITLNGDATGDQTLDEQPVSRVSGIEYMVVKEVPNTGGYSRQAFTLTTVYDSGPDNRAEGSSTQNVIASVGGITWTTAALLVNSSGTYGDDSGEAAYHVPTGTTNTIANLQDQPIVNALIMANAPLSATGV